MERDMGCDVLHKLMLNDVLQPACLLAAVCSEVLCAVLHELNII